MNYPIINVASRLAKPVGVVSIAIGMMVASMVHAGTITDFSDLVQQVTPGVAKVTVYKKISQNELAQQQLPELFQRFFGGQGQQFHLPSKPAEQMAYGSAFFVGGDGYLLTNNHVIDNASKITITLNDREELDATLVGADERTDVAVLKVKKGNYPALKLGDSNQLKVGQPVLAIGAPFGFDYSASSGIISAISRNLNNETSVPFIQTDVPLNPGNSGGPLFNQRGEVIGMNSRIFSGTGGYMGLSFSIPIDVAMGIADQLQKNGKVTRAYLGVYPQDVDRNLAEAYGMEKPRGALITKVMDDSAASVAGLQAGDVILAVNGKSVIRAFDLINMINLAKPDDRVVLQVQRDQKTMQVTAVLKKLQDDEQVNDSNDASSANAKLGMTVRELTVQEKQSLNIEGVVVTALESGAGAARAGINVGDVIVQVNKQPTPDYKTLISVYKKLPAKGVVVVRLIRQGVPRIVGMRIDKQPS